MKEKRRITFTGKNLNDIFKLEPVYKIMKVAGVPKVFLRSEMLLMLSSSVVACPGDQLVEYDNGLWEIEHVKH